MHPLPFSARGDDSGPAQVGEVPRDLGLALTEDLDEVADADFAAIHEVEQAQTRAIGEGGEERSQIGKGDGPGHKIIIYALTYMNTKNTFV